MIHLFQNILSWQHNLAVYECINLHDEVEGFNIPPKIKSYLKVIISCLIRGCCKKVPKTVSKKA